MENLKIDKWYKVLILAGAYLVFASLQYKIDFLPQKYLFGFGLGIFLLGLSYFKSDKLINHISGGGILTIPQHIPDILSVTFLISGFICMCWFGYKVAFYIF